MVVPIEEEGDGVDDCVVQPVLARSATVAILNAAEVRRFMTATMAQGCARVLCADRCLSYAS